MENIIERMRDAEQLKLLPMNERLLGALIVTALGLGITFVILTALLCITRLMSKAGTGKKEDVSDAAETEAPLPAGNSVSTKTAAAIMAAVACMEGPGRFAVRNIRPARRPAEWLASGRAESDPGPRMSAKR